MAAWTTTSSRTALRNRMGVNSTQFSDSAADAALEAALDRISAKYPLVASTSLTSQTSRRLSVTAVTWRQILAVEVPMDDDPRTFQDWQHEETGVIRLPYYEPSSEDVRIWYTGTWVVTNLPDRWQQACLAGSLVFGITEQNIQQMIYWSQGGDAAFSNSLTAIIRDAREEWRRAERNLERQGAELYDRWGSARARLY